MPKDIHLPVVGRDKMSDEEDEDYDDDDEEEEDEEEDEEEAEDTGEEGRRLHLNLLFIT